MNQSAQLFSRARSVIPGGVNSPVRAFRNVDGDPFFVQSAKGAYITWTGGWAMEFLRRRKWIWRK